MFDAEEKKGCAVGIQLVALDENGAKISDTESEWYGFKRGEANELSLSLTKACQEVIAETAGTKR